MEKSIIRVFFNRGYTLYISMFKNNLLTVIEMSTKHNVRKFVQTSIQNTQNIQIFHLTLC